MVTRSGNKRQSRDAAPKNEVRVITRTRSSEARENRRTSSADSFTEDATEISTTKLAEEVGGETHQLNLVDGDPLKTAEAISSESDTDAAALSNSCAPQSAMYQPEDPTMDDDRLSQASNSVSVEEKPPADTGMLRFS